MKKAEKAMSEEEVAKAAATLAKQWRDAYAAYRKTKPRDRYTRGYWNGTMDMIEDAMELLGYCVNDSPEFDNGEWIGRTK
jgi:hypothetical protein